MSEVDSQIGATPFDVVNRNLTNFGEKVTNKTPRDESSILKVAPAASQPKTQQGKVTVNDKVNYSPMLMGMGQPVHSANVSSFDNDV